MIELRVVQSTVTVVAHPVVVSGTRHPVVAHVPLADMRRLVAQLLQMQMVIRQPVTHRVARDVVDDAVTTCILTRDDRCPVGRADWSRVESALEQGALVRDAVDVRRFHVRMSARPELVVTQIVDQNHHEIGFHLARVPH